MSAPTLAELITRSALPHDTTVWDLMQTTSLTHHAANPLISAGITTMGQLGRRRDISLVRRSRRLHPHEGGSR